MNTQELKQYIDRVLGNNIRCLLPSYWWKKLFGEVVDNIDTIKSSVNKLNSKIQDIKFYEKITHADLLDKVLNEKLIPGKQYAITDYECTVNRFINGVSSTYSDKQGYTIIVTANSTHELNENVELAMANGHYSNDKTESTFEAKYTVFNDASIFNWAKKEDPYIRYFIILDNPPYSHLAKQAVSWSEKERKLITNYRPEETYSLTGILVDSQGNPVDLNTDFSYGDTAYVKMMGEIYSGKIVYTSSMRESGDAVLVATNTSHYLPNEFMCFVWNEDSQTYTDTEGYTLLDTNQNIINTKESIFVSGGRYRESNYKRLCYPMGFGESGGKGVIYYLKDQNGNEAPYDFKNIIFYIPDAGYASVFTFNGSGNNSIDGSRYGSRYINVKIEDNNGNINKVAFSGYTNNVKVSSAVYDKYFTEDISNKKIGIDSKHNLVIANEFDDTIIDSKINRNSTNPVENKAIANGFDMLKKLMFHFTSSGGYSLVTDTSSFEVDFGNNYVINTESAGDIVITGFNALELPSDDEYSFLNYIQKATIMFKGATSLTLPEGVIWANGEQPDIDPSLEYELSIVRTIIADTITYKAVLTPFYLP